MKANTIYNAVNDGVISGKKAQEFFFDECEDYSLPGDYVLPNEDFAKKFLSGSLQAQVANSPSLYEWACEMAKKYGVRAPKTNAKLWEMRGYKEGR